MGKDAVWRLYLALRVTDYHSLADFSRNFGVCMKTVADVENALKLCIRPMRKTLIGKCAVNVLEDQVASSKSSCSFANKI